MVNEHFEKGMKKLSKEERKEFAERYGLNWIGRIVDIHGLVRAKRGSKYFHVRYADGTPAYTARFAQVGNFQEDGLAPAKSREDKKFLHIRLDGTPAYTARFDMLYDDGSFSPSGITWAEKDGKIYEINRQGEILRPVSFSC
ncbi:MAG TPA: hypothetical protein PKM85_01935 [Candidatus Pacearchaeota archaeon]|nr:hypothetical protein [Candidatus Pacearchaeota archaeon]